MTRGEADGLSNGFTVSPRSLNVSKCSGEEDTRDVRASKDVMQKGHLGPPPVSFDVTNRQAHIYNAHQNTHTTRKFIRECNAPNDGLQGVQRMCPFEPIETFLPSSGASERQFSTNYGF